MDMSKTDGIPIFQELWFEADIMKDKNSRFADPTRVLIVDHQGLLGAGLSSLLANESPFEVLGTTGENETSLVQAIWHLRPEIVLLAADYPVVHPLRLFDLLPDYGRLRIILVRESSDVIEDFQKEETTIDSSTALIDLLKRK